MTFGVQLSKRTDLYCVRHLKPFLSAWTFWCQSGGTNKRLIPLPIWEQYCFVIDYRNRKIAWLNYCNSNSLLIMRIEIGILTNAIRIAIAVKWLEACKTQQWNAVCCMLWNLSWIPGGRIHWYRRLLQSDCATLKCDFWFDSKIPDRSLTSISHWVGAHKHAIWYTRQPTS